MPTQTTASSNFPYVPLSVAFSSGQDVDDTMRSVTSGILSWADSFPSASKREGIKDNWLTAWEWLGDDALGTCCYLGDMLGSIEYDLSDEARNIRNLVMEIFDFFDYIYYV